MKSFFEFMGLKIKARYWQNIFWLLPSPQVFKELETFIWAENVIETTNLLFNQYNVC